MINIQKNSRLYKIYGKDIMNFFIAGCNRIEYILPHLEISDIKVLNDCFKWKVTYSSNQRREIKVVLGFQNKDHHGSICFVVRRRRIPSGIGQIARTISEEEREICGTVIKLLEEIKQIIIGSKDMPSEIINSVAVTFDEYVISRYLMNRHNIQHDLAL